MPKNDWNEYKRLFISELEENRKFRATVTEVLTALKEDVSGLKVKAAIVGGVAGIVGTSVVGVILKLMH